ncbi:hypothetical protein [Synechocystis sp. LKSZ1]|uniref:hypothetical protein n=1 Tax=Synechocystis sp. LKSZ1 TaxID=3144951 RepID=UPI00336BD324
MTSALCTRSPLAQNPQALSCHSLGQILIRKKLISEYQLLEAVELQHSYRLKLGELLVRCGYIAPTQLEEALREQQWRRQGLWVIG